MYKILIVDDDKTILDMIEQLLDQEGHLTLRATSAHEALALIERATPHMVVIDVNLPGMDGITLCRRLRLRPELSETPIIFITGEDSSYSVVEALGAGGDDYIRKPFALRELAARIRAHLRRVAQQYTNEDLPRIRIYPDTYRVFVNEREIELTRVEFDLLLYLCDSPEEWHSTRDLLANVWSYPQGVGDAALVRNHIRNLRRKLEDTPERPEIIQSRHGRGYIIRANVEVFSSASRNLARVAVRSHL